MPAPSLEAEPQLDEEVVLVDRARVREEAPLALGIAGLAEGAVERAARLAREAGLEIAKSSDVREMLKLKGA